MSRQNQLSAQVVEKIIKSLETIQYGSVEIVVHDSRVVQIEKKEKVRFETRESS